MVKYLFTSILLLSVLSVNAQNKFSIKGNVIDKNQNNISISFVNVFLEGTTFGTQTDNEGNFIIKNIPMGSYRLVASMVGYLPTVYNIEILDKNNEIQISLVEDIEALNEVKVIGSRDKVWEKQFKEFEREFLGNNFSKKEVKILNKEVIDFKFDKETTTFTAVANQPIIIENLKLGYKLTYVLDGFERKSNRIAYQGFSYYELIEPQNDKQKIGWEENRIEAYQGSLRHFLKSLLNNTLREEGFKAFYLDIDSTNSTKTISVTINPQDIVQATSSPNTYSLIINKPIRILYENARLPPQYSEIKQLSEILINDTGYLLDPYAIEFSGKMAEKRTANLLPYDFEILENVAIIIPSYLPKQLKTLASIPREIVKIEGIKPYYLAGERLSIEINVAKYWLKVASNQNLIKDKLSPSSVPLYVDLIDLTQGKIVERFIVKLNEGSANLSFSTSMVLSTGNYQIRAYTNWMRNFSEKGFFKQNFTVFSQNYQQEFARVQHKKSLFDTLLIHTEGGYLVDSLKSKITVETIDSFGKKNSIPFSLLNNKNDTLIIAQTDSAGIATFNLIPRKTEIYRIIAENKVYTLPNALPKGTIFTVDNLSSKEKLRVFIQTNKISNDKFILVLMKEEQMVAWKNFEMNKNSILINIPKNRLFGEINCFLIDNNGMIIAERLIDVNLSEITQDAIAIDRELMSQPPTEFLYFKQLLDYPVEKGLTLKGKIESLNGKENKKEIRLSMVLSNTRNDTTKQNIQTFFTKAKNQFAFQNLDFFGKTKVTFIAPNNKVILDTLSDIPPILNYKMPINWYLIQSKEGFADIAKKQEEVFLENTRQARENIKLDEVEIRAKKMDVNAVNGISPNIVLDEKRIINQPTMSGLLYLLIPPRKKRFGTGLKVFIDSQELRQDEIDNIDLDITPSSVEKVLVFEEVIPAIYGRATCAIVIVLQRGASKANFKSNDSFIVEGYYK